MSVGSAPRLHLSKAGARSAALPDANDIPAAAAAASEARALIEKLACVSMNARSAAASSNDVKLDEGAGLLACGRGTSSDGKASAAGAGAPAVLLPLFFLFFCCRSFSSLSSAAAFVAAVPFHSVSRDASRSCSR